MPFKRYVITRNTLAGLLKEEERKKKDKRNHNISTFWFKFNSA
jgi:hypothetical protein